MMETIPYQTLYMRFVRSDGRVLEMGKGTMWVITELIGWGDLDLTVNMTPNVLSDGSSLVSKRVNDKDRTVKATYVGKSDKVAAHENVSSFFNPKFTYKAYVTPHECATRWVEGELYDRDIPPIKANGDPSAIFTLLCPDPYFRDIDGNESAFGDSVPMLGWPYVSYADEEGLEYPPGLVSGVLVFDGLNSIVNGGDVTTAYKVRIEAQGKLVNPTITKDGRFVRMLLNLSVGDVLEIDFESAPPKVTKNGQNVIHYASRDSAFTKMAMQPGKNVFSFTVDNEENRSLAKVQVLFHEKFLGV